MVAAGPCGGVCRMSTGVGVGSTMTVAVGNTGADGVGVMADAGGEDWYRGGESVLVCC